MLVPRFLRPFAFPNYWGKQGSRARVRLYQRTKAGHWALVRGASCLRRRSSRAGRCRHHHAEVGVGPGEDPSQLDRLRGLLQPPRWCGRLQFDEVDRTAGFIVIKDSDDKPATIGVGRPLIQKRSHTSFDCFSDYFEMRQFREVLGHIHGAVVLSNADPNSLAMPHRA
jgi:hypothetical protein